MVTLTQIRESNAQITSASIPRVALFVGGTSGIGKAALTSLANLNIPFKAYVIGRPSSAASFNTYSDELVKKNAQTEIIWIEGDITLLKEVQRISEYIKTIEQRIDMLFMSAGHAPLGGRTLTTEGLDISQSLNFYTRILFTLHLLPLLRTAPSPRVISVFAGGMEFSFPLPLNTSDLNLDRAGPWGFMLSQAHMGIMNTLTLDHISRLPGNENVTFIHSHPGFVRTGNVYRGFAPGSWGPWIASLTLDPMMMLLGFSREESAERYLYQITSSDFGTVSGGGIDGDRQVVRHGGEKGMNTMGGRKGGLWLVSKNCDVVNHGEKLVTLRDENEEKVWENVQGWLGDCYDF